MARPEREEDLQVSHQDSFERSHAFAVAAGLLRKDHAEVQSIAAGNPEVVADWIAALEQQRDRLRRDVEFVDRAIAALRRARAAQPTELAA